MVLPQKPEPVDEDENEAGVIEGYLELGMAAQALEELNKASAGSSLSLEILLLRLRVLAANLDTRAALDLFHDTARRVPQARVLLAEKRPVWPPLGCAPIFPRTPTKPRSGRMRRAR